MSAAVLLTGATGFLGAQIARRLLERTDAAVVALVRAESRAAAERRLARAWWDWPDAASAVGGRVEALEGDVSRPHLGLDDAAFAGLVGRVSHVIHAAADLRLDAPLDDLRMTNVRGPGNVLEFARAVHRDHGLDRLAHVSTAYVAGGREGEIPEDDLGGARGFANGYERSKYEGERLMQAAKDELPVSVFRPGMVVGDSRTGAIKTFNTLYFPLRLYLAGKLRLLPARPSLRVNLVPVDYVAEAVVRLTFEPRAAGLNFHLTAPWEMLPTARELVDFVRAWAGARLGVRLPRAVFVPLPASSRGPGKSHASPLRALLPYFNERRRFRRDNAERLLGPYAIEWREALPRLLEFAVYNGFMHRSERTVHEQILFRLAHRGRPVTYHDFVEGRLVRRDAAAVRRDILAAAASLRAMGVRAGDRVALVGVNSTRYLSLDAAIGLAGAVGVPLYYTSPPGECDEIIAASGAKLLLVGAIGILERLGEMRSAVPVVSFCRGAPPAGLPPRVIAWERFLAAGGGGAGPAGAASVAPVGPRDLATVRYTSGTTGRAKGVCFDHAGLRWMAETVCSLHPWRARTWGVTCLSFLPMSHVVEGIIAAYSPYYAPSPLNICFLEDFDDLQSALRRVRPTIFFAVPRLFEKVAARLRGSATGRAYLSAGPCLRRVLRPLLRRAVLRRAGLDRCVQLVVGSAPCGEELLRGFRELGIEVHNAYGLTEAPLVTMNLPGDNRLGTVGRPLPRTELRIAADGEIMVRGPQVASGCLDPAYPSPFRDGWLLTGDYGHVDEEGFLVLEGRKKELISTSYAKKIDPGKVEALLRSIPGVDEALVAGDGRPFCCALLWASGPCTDETVGAIETAIADAGKLLSRPERVKRWAILENDLSIERGDLTANGKLRRRRVAERLNDVIEALYGGAAPRTGGVIRIGGEEKP